VVLSKLPFEDGIFISLYSIIILRPILFCDAYNQKNKKKYTANKFKFSQSAIQSAYAIYLDELTPSQIVQEVHQNYNNEKSGYYFYIIYLELSRRKNRIASQFLKLVKASRYPSLFNKIFKTFEHKLAWDYVLIFLVNEEFSIELFTFLWNRYRDTLLICKKKSYNNFISKQYFDNGKKKLEFTDLINTDSHLEFIVNRAEKTYFDINLFKKE
jgi:hypothetical protein